MPLVEATVVTRESADDGGAIVSLTCAECGQDNLVTGWIDPRPEDPSDAGYLKYNEATELFDEFDDHGFLTRANIPLTPNVRFPGKVSSPWPGERPAKSKRSSSEMWLIDGRAPGASRDARGDDR